MPTSSTYVITGNAMGNVNSTLAANGYDKIDKNSKPFTYARVLNTFPDKSIVYELLVDNLSPSLVGTNYTGSSPAYPYSNTIGKLPLPGEIVRIFNGPEPYSTSDLPAHYRPQIYYEPAPLSAWQDVNNNIILNNQNTPSNINNDLKRPSNVKTYINSSNGF
jgi:hypothetical protein